jgi:hypothetical protein
MPLTLKQGSLHGFWLHTCALGGGVGVCKQARGTFNWAHQGLIVGGGSAGEVLGGGRRLGSGGASAAARVPAKCGAN